MIILLKKQPMLYLLIIFVLAAFLRFYGLNWDQGFHLHPDERAIVMFTTALEWPKNINEFFSPNSSWNPHFFAYGSFPIYLLKIAGDIGSIFDPSLGRYDGINLIGRFLSSLFDIGTLYMVFLIGKKLFDTKVGLLGAFFYGISVLPIQLSHFYAVDTPLTFFAMLTLWWLIHLYEKPSKKHALLVGFFFGLSLVTKTSALVLLVAIGLALAVDFLLIFLKNPHRTHIWFPRVPRFLKRLMFDGFMIAVSTIITFSILQPYAIIDFQEFLRQTQQTSQVIHNAFAFPFTLQYVGKISYIYELKNIFLWGQGPLLTILSAFGVSYIIFLILKKEKKEKWAQELILLTFLIAYFAIVGKFAIGFMRYLLPLYPLFCLFGATFVLKVLIPNINRLISKQFSIFNFQFSIGLLVVLVFIGSILVWPLSFMHIYTQPNTRVLASEWIYSNIPADKKIAFEHWDDGLPIGGNIAYKTLGLPIYGMENPLTEKQIYQTVQEADYIIIASNRLYAPLQRLSKNCQKWNLPLERCSKNANRYYEKLFNGELEYTKVAEFSIYPKIPILNIQINDQGADESFTVYDHPKVMIFKKEN